MKNLFDPTAAEEIRGRLAQLRTDSPRQWGKMTPSQVVAHCAASMEMATGDVRPPRMFVGRLLGGLVKPMALGNDEPMKRNSPTSKDLVIKGEPNLDAERARLRSLIDRFVSGGAAACTTHPHTFFGSMTAEQWAVLMYKHLDHHLRQFGV